LYFVNILYTFKWDLGWDLGFGMGLGLGFGIGMGMGFGIWDGMGWDGMGLPSHLHSEIQYIGTICSSKNIWYIKISDMSKILIYWISYIVR
jgi:hypothetical protein